MKGPQHPKSLQRVSPAQRRSCQGQERDGLSCQDITATRTKSFSLQDVCTYFSPALNSFYRIKKKIPKPVSLSNSSVEFGCQSWLSCHNPSIHTHTPVFKQHETAKQHQTGLKTNQLLTIHLVFSPLAAINAV